MEYQDRPLRTKVISDEEHQQRAKVEDRVYLDRRAEKIELKAAPAKTPVMTVPGYEKLQDVLERAYGQAAIGKGSERHAKGEPFHEQVMQIGAQKFGVGSLLFQAFKKSEESQRLPQDRAIAELLGAINYLAGAVIALEAQTGNESKK